MPTTIQDLAPEILSEIIALAAKSVSYYYGALECLRFLAGTCLVSRSWQGPGQFNLWRKIRLNDYRGDSLRPRQFAGSAATQRGLATDSMTLMARITSAHARLVLSAANSLRKLEMYHLGNSFDLGLLELETLQDLKELTIDSITFSNTAKMPSFPFQLERLRIDFRSFSSIPTYLPAFLAPSLTSLALDVNSRVNGNLPPFTNPEIWRVLTSHAPHLVELKLRGAPDPHTASFLPKFLEMCSTLSQFRVAHHDLALLVRLPGRLRTLEISGTFGIWEDEYEGRSEEIVALFGKGGPSCLKSLDRLSINISECGFVGDKDEAAKGIIETCEKRKIKFEWEAQNKGE